MAKFRKGCPMRPYRKFAHNGNEGRGIARRPIQCPCTWTDWTILLHYSLVKIELADMEHLGDLFPE